jgi:hypothetical protein
MSSLRSCLLTLAVVVPALVYVQPAFACGPTPCAQLNDVQPTDGSVGVALDTEIRVLYFGTLDPASQDTTCDVDLRSMRLLPNSGAPIELSGSWLMQSGVEAWIVAKPGTPLAASTEYHVQLQLGHGVDVCGCEEREWTTVASFTSGSAADDEAPGFLGIEALEYGPRYDGDSSCGYYSGIPASSEVTAEPESFPGLRYNVYVDGEIARRYVEDLRTGEHSANMFVDCGTMALTTGLALNTGSSFEVRAVDLSGNESLPKEPIGIEASCGATVELPEASPSTSPELRREATITTVTGAATADRSASSSSASGCALSPRSASNAGAALGALLLVWGLRRKAARAGTPPSS